MFLWIVSCSLFLFVLCIYFSVLFHFVSLCLARNLSSLFYILLVLIFHSTFAKKIKMIKIKIVTKRKAKVG